MLEKAFTAHCDITALFSLLSCLTLPVLLFLLLLFSINVCLFFFSLLFFFPLLFALFCFCFCFFTLYFFPSVSVPQILSLSLACSTLLHATHHPS